MIMVDELKRWPTRIRCFQAGSCHLMTDDGDLEALHAFAARLGLRRSWFQPLSTPHYDLTASKRALALELGATFVPARAQAVARLTARRAKGAGR